MRYLAHRSDQVSKLHFFLGCAPSPPSLTPVDTLRNNATMFASISQNMQQRFPEQLLRFQQNSFEVHPPHLHHLRRTIKLDLPSSQICWVMQNLNHRGPLQADLFGGVLDLGSLRACFFAMRVTSFRGGASCAACKHIASCLQVRLVEHCHRLDLVTPQLPFPSFDFHPCGAGRAHAIYNATVQLSVVGLHTLFTEVADSYFRPPANAADPVAGCKLQAAKLEAARLQLVRLGNARLRRARLQDASCKAAGCKVARLQGARLQAAKCKVAGCKAAGDRLRTARLQAPELQSESAILVNSDMQKPLHLPRAATSKTYDLF
jgi:hypothetical protein